MIAGVGIDLCEISRMEKLLEDGKFLRRFFAPEEQAYILNKGKTAPQTMAGIFAAKEALLKALGTGLSGGDMKDICVLHDDLGAPYYDLRNEIQACAAARGFVRLFLSVTHEAGLAAAVCVAEKEG